MIQTRSWNLHASCLSFGHGRFNLIVDYLALKDFTPDLWYQRASPKQEIVTWDDNSTVCMKYATHFFMIVSDPMAIRPLLVLGACMFGLSAVVLPLYAFCETFNRSFPQTACTKRRPGQWYGATLFVGVDFILFIFIGVGQGFIFKTVKEKGKRTRKHSNPLSQLRQNQRIQEFTIAKYLSLVVMTDFLCWFPIITMGLMALSGVDMGEAAYRWSAMLVLPINSALNPLLYLTYLTAVPCRTQR